jgi:hypothetical protein
VQELEDGSESHAVSASGSDTPTRFQDPDRIDCRTNEAPAFISHGCPVCLSEFRRVQERDRHVESHLPCSILCPFKGCAWTGRRRWDFGEHQRKRHLKTGQVTSEDGIKLYDPKALVNMILRGTPFHEVARLAFTMAQESLERLGKRTNVLGHNRGSRTWIGAPSALPPIPPRPNMALR